MMILRRKEIVAAAMVVLIGMAGYLNWHYKDNITVRDGASYVEAGKRIGEAQYVMNNTNAEVPEDEQTFSSEKSDDYFETVKSERETARSKALDVLNTTAANKEFDTEIRKKAQEEILKISEDVQNESSIENVARAKGYDKICVYILDDNVTISVQKDEFNDTDAAKIQDIATQQLKISTNKIKIVEVK